ncbi:MAG: cyclic nucleotide-binding domain-containing protein [Alkalispirochaeta sp.]
MYSERAAKEAVAVGFEGCGTTRPVSTGEVLFREGEPAGEMCIILSGTCEVTTVDGHTGEPLLLGTVGPGDIVGEIAALLGGVRSASVRAVNPGEIRVVGRDILAGVLTDRTDLAEALEEIVRDRLRRNRQITALRRFLGSTAPAILNRLLERCTVATISRGEYLFRTGDIGNGLYLVVSGVLEVRVSDDEGGEETVARIRRGEPVGEMALISEDVRSASVAAVRQCELLRLERTEFERLIPEYPELLMGITRKLVERMRTARSDVASGYTGQNIAVVGTLQDASSPGDLSETERIAVRLYDAMPQGVNAYILTSRHIAASFGDGTVPHLSRESPRGVALDAWLEELESIYDVLFLIADSSSTDELSGWTRRCLAHADGVLVLGDDALPEYPEGMEARVYREGNGTITTAVDLLLIHPEGTVIPTGTARRLRNRPVRSHFHLRIGSDVDFQRVARSITGRAAGVALGGGGARGVAHVGALEALAGEGIPVDFIAGTSMGAVVGALWGMGRRPQEILAAIKEMFVRRKPFSEYTWPIYGLLRGNRPRKAATDTFGDLGIEDLWIPFVCTSTNLSRQRLCVHDRGPIAPAILATTAVPGAAIPPIRNGELHVDGGVLNNLPGDLLPDFCAWRIVCDVSPAQRLRVEGDAFPSPLDSLRGRLKRRVAVALRSRTRAFGADRGASSPGAEGATTAPTTVVPRIGAILYSAMTVGSQAHARSVREAADLSLQPPVESFGLLAFREARKIHEIGYSYTVERVREWATDGRPGE